MASHRHLAGFANGASATSGCRCDSATDAVQAMVEEIVNTSQECVDRAKLDRELQNRMVRDQPGNQNELR